MKQVTGATNNKPEIKNVSIRLRLDGHSFSEEKLDIPAKEKKTVEIEVLTGKTMLVPREVFDAKAAPALMRINGMEPTEKECILTSDPQQPVIALMAADKASVEKVRARLKEKIRWTSPLLRTGEFTASCLWIFRYEELAYLKVWERQTLRLAETFIAPTGEDLLFYVRELTQELQIENCEIRLEGNPTKQDGRLLREYFKRRHMRIVSGKYRGRAINPPKNLRARPTTDFAKENLFNVLGNLVDFEECDVLDLFAGTGSISYEFASRGVHSVTSVEINPVHYNFIKKTAADLGIDNLFAVKANVFLYLKSCAKQFDLIFSDAPYDLEGSEEVIRLVLERDLLKPDGFLVFEHSKNINFSSDPHFWQSRSYGSVQFSFFKK